MRILRRFKLLITAILLFGAVLSPIGLSFGQVASEQYSYDTLGRLSTVTYANGTTVTYVYDAAGNRKQLITSGTGPSTDHVSITQTKFVSGPIVIYGTYNTTTAYTLTGGTTMSVYDQFAENGVQFLNTTLLVKGFTGDPGAAWLTSIALGSQTRTGSSASYGYGGGQAIWQWTSAPLGLGGSGVVVVTVVHQ